MTTSPAPFVRFSRDKRGYESVYLVHVSGRPARPRVLYWFRTPPGVKLGRSPFDEDVRRALEQQYPDIRFDWKRIVETQPPPVPEVEHWRERRRAERSAKQARQAAMRDRGETPPPDAVDDGPDEADGNDPLPETPIADLVASPEADAPTGPLREAADSRNSREADEADDPEEAGESEPGDSGGPGEYGEPGEPGEIDASGNAGQATEVGGALPEHRRRRRRRGGRRRNRGAQVQGAGPSVDGVASPAIAEAPEPAADPAEPSPPAGTGDPSS